MPIITHGDLDGFVSALIVMELENIVPTRVYHYSYASYRDDQWKKLLDYQFGGVDQLAADLENVWFVDLSLRPTELEWARNKQKRSLWHWVDHHPSSSDFDYEGIFSIVALYPDGDQCASDLLWEMYQQTRRTNPILEAWVMAAHDRDLWIREYPDRCLKLDFMVKSQGRIKNGWIPLLEEAKTLSPMEMILIHDEWWKNEMRDYERSVKLALATKSVSQAADLSVVMAYISGFGSDVGESLYSEKEEEDILIMIHAMGDSLIVNLRTRRDDLDLSLLAKEMFEGGGHKQAAGGKLEMKHLKGGYNAIARDIRTWRQRQLPKKRREK